MKRRTAARHAAAKIGGQTNPGNPTLDLSSLVDIAFLLLIYFLVTSTLDPKEADLGFSMVPPPGIPKDTSKNFFIPEPNRLKVLADGSVYLNEELVEPGQPDSRKMPALVTRLKELKYLEDSLRRVDGFNLVPVTLAADDSVKGQRFMDVMDALTESGIGSVMLEGFTE